MAKHQVVLTLCRLSAMAISNHLWRYSHLRDALQSCILEDAAPEETMPLVLRSLLDKLIVPEPAKEELMLAVGTMGYKIWRWIEGLQKIDAMTGEDSLKLRADVDNHMRSICWTSHGCIDYSETLRFLYVSRILPESYSTWIKLCHWCLEDCINDLWSKLPNLDRYIHDNINTSEFDLALATYRIARKDDALEFVTLDGNLYDAAFSLEENMFIFSFVSINCLAAQYFWQWMDNNQRMKAIAHVCEKIISDDSDTLFYNQLLFSDDDECVDLLVFLLQQLTFYRLEDLRNGVLSSPFGLRPLLQWPYDNLFLKAIDELSIHGDSMYYVLVVSDILIQRKTQYLFLHQDVKYHRIFCELWKTNPQNFKSFIDYSNLLDILWTMKDVELLKYILNDDALKDKRTELLNKIVEINYRATTCGIGDSDFEKEFVTKVLVSKEEREWFRCQNGMMEEYQEMMYMVM